MHLSLQHLFNAHLDQLYLVSFLETSTISLIETTLHEVTLCNMVMTIHQFHLLKKKQKTTHMHSSQLLKISLYFDTQYFVTFQFCHLPSSDSLLSLVSCSIC